MHISSEIKTIVKNAVQKIDSKFDLGLKEFDTISHIEHPSNPQFGDYSTNVAMQIWQDKTLREKVISSDSNIKSPRQMAEVLLGEIHSDLRTSNIDKVEIAGAGFINFHLSNDFLFSELKKVLSEGAEYGKPAKGVIKREKISVEHTQVNPNKAPHVGHLRNAVIGDSIVRILKFLGHDVVTLYYQNDAGLQVASIVLAYKKRYIVPEDFDNILNWASAAYVDIESRIGEVGKTQDQKLYDEREVIQKNVSEQNNDDADLAKELTDKILYEILKIFGDLGIPYDVIVCESDITKKNLWGQTFELLKKSKSFYQSKSGKSAGCWLVKMPHGEDKIIVRSNGVPTYAGNDIANHLWKFGILPDFDYKKLDWNLSPNPLYITSGSASDMNKTGLKHGAFTADEIVNIIDTTQTYPQQSVKEAFEALGYKDLKEKYNHVNYGFVYLSASTAKKLGVLIEGGKPSVKMSGRRGSVVSVLDFIHLLKEHIEADFGKHESSELVSKGSAKFEMLKYNTFQDIVFDLDTAVDQKGFSAPYLQYTFARATSVIKKSKIKKSHLLSQLNSSIPAKADDILLRKIYQFEEVIVRSAEDSSPHYICTYLFELAQEFNAFYNSSPILGSQDEAYKLSLTLAVATIIQAGLNLLGIEAPESM